MGFIWDEEKEILSFQDNLWERLGKSSNNYLLVNHGEIVSSLSVIIEDALCQLKATCGCASQYSQALKAVISGTVEEFNHPANDEILNAANQLRRFFFAEELIKITRSIIRDTFQAQLITLGEVHSFLTQILVQEYERYSQVNYEGEIQSLLPHQKILKIISRAQEEEINPHTRFIASLIRSAFNLPEFGSRLPLYSLASFFYLSAPTVNFTALTQDLEKIQVIASHPESPSFQQWNRQWEACHHEPFPIPELSCREFLYDLVLEKAISAQNSQAISFLLEDNVNLAFLYQKAFEQTLLAQYSDGLDIVLRKPKQISSIFLNAANFLLKNEEAMSFLVTYFFKTQEGKEKLTGILRLYTDLLSKDSILNQVLILFFKSCSKLEEGEKFLIEFMTDGKVLEQAIMTNSLEVLIDLHLCLQNPSFSPYQNPSHNHIFKRMEKFLFMPIEDHLYDYKFSDPNIGAKTQALLDPITKKELQKIRIALLQVGMLYLLHHLQEKPTTNLVCVDFFEKKFHQVLKDHAADIKRIKKLNRGRSFFDVLTAKHVFSLPRVAK